MEPCPEAALSKPVFGNMTYWKTGLTSPKAKIGPGHAGGEKAVARQKKSQRQNAKIVMRLRKKTKD